ncbi:Rho GTPase-activating protein 8 [Fulvia fulva]|uniref:Rho GTPase-activating protein 8 n=1 Tax=Passalora fulva TaxID=5499 RepID=A0A9Q8PKN1_PASFU|nr:Rho GTPase-activating protein 8 [Fulvia fulva]KAK4610694.1 Rho GTPase-activating protein 8 [Fulvia fulva]KAK4611071.1 Rho GTPase-activating protein 8 [Fulvia fulva]UJO24228.1 Rho GTPase-activating protein 8 [Fulvia fulva]WPV22180.1 Rho GTPase-activating protein 8 [Fulvia fulva]WPV37251.1 Rho GTPase-activating protein 8 [Fulvia fulva]
MPAGMRAAFAAATQRNRARSGSLSTVAPAETDDDYIPELAAVAASILYKSPLPSLEGRPIYILNAAAFPDAFDVDYDSLLAYVLARLPGEEELIQGAEYEIVFFAGGTPDNATAEKKSGPATGWYLQAYHVLSRATRKKLQKLYIVHPRTWVRVLISVFGTIVSPKFRRKIVHVTCLSQLALHVPVEKLVIPPTAYLQDRKVSPDVYAPFMTGKRAFGVRHPLPKNIDSGETRLPRVLRETTSFLLMPPNIKTEGIFRIPPHSTLLGILKEAYDRGQQFIVWKERDATFVQPDMPPALVDEVKLEDAYGVHLAASLIKQWYRDLKEPIVPESSYTVLREKYHDPTTEVTPEDLVDFIIPTSIASPLTVTAREIMIRHLLPLLSAVALHEADNKMSAENLAICFSMCLICGSDQLNDAQVSSIVKRILQAAIELWPQLRTGMNIDSKRFTVDLQPPADSREYEDPLESAKPKRISEADDGENEKGHRILLEDSDSSRSLSPEGEKPALPPRRRSRAASLGKALAANIRDIDLSNMPSIQIPKPKMEFPSLPKRKPAPHHAEPPSPYREDAPLVDTSETVTVPPPRYSSMFDAQGRDFQVADFPASYVPVDGFGPLRRAEFSFQKGRDEIKRSSAPEPRIEPQDIHVAVPHRKPVSSHKTSPNASADPSPSVSRSSSSGTNAMLARMAAQQAADSMAMKTNNESTKPIPIAIDTSNMVSTSTDTSAKSAVSEGDGVFRKPSWPASASRQPSNIQSLARPALPTRKSNTIPMIANHDGSRDGRGSLSAPHVPKPRTPSPGLLKRMESMESNKSTHSLEPKKLNLKKASVDDLRRLYEERATTVQSLAEAGRRASNQQ